MSVESLLAAYIIEDQTGSFEAIVDTLVQNSLGLQDVIELLELYLTNSEDRIRSRATLLVASLLEQTQLVKASSPVLHLFVVFFCRRMRDYASISPCITALTTIMRLYVAELDPKFCDLLDIIHSTTKSVHIPSYAQNVRQKALEMLRLIVDSEELVRQLRGSGGRLLEGITNCIEGEKDPRCLLIGLRCIHVAMVKFVSNLDEIIYIADDQLSIAEHIFDIVSRYFPISFVPPPDDPAGITSEELTLALDDCICATKQVATNAVSFLIDQLILEDSDSRVAALTTLTRIVREHGVGLLVADKATASFGKSMGGTTAASHKMITDDDDEGDDDSLDHSHNYDYRNGGIAQLRRLSELLFEASIHEASERILAGIHQLSEEISRSICSSTSIDSDHPIWKVFVEGIIAKVLKEVQSTGLDNLKARGAWRLCRSIGQGGGFKSCALIVEWFLPTAIQGIDETAARVTTSVNRTMKAIQQGVELLPSLSAQDRIHPGNLALLDGIITLSSPSEGGLDVSGLREFQLLSQDRINDITSLLLLFLRPFSLDPSNIKAIGEDKMQSSFDDDVFTSIGLAIGALRELLFRASNDNETLYHQVIRTITSISIDGMKHFIPAKEILNVLHHADKLSKKLQSSTQLSLETLACRQQHIPALLTIAYPELVKSDLGFELITNISAKENGAQIIQHIITQLVQSFANYDSVELKRYVHVCYKVFCDNKCLQVATKAVLFAQMNGNDRVVIIQTLERAVLDVSDLEFFREACLLLERIMLHTASVQQQTQLFNNVIFILEQCGSFHQKAQLLLSAVLYLDKSSEFFASSAAMNLLSQMMALSNGDSNEDREVALKASAIIVNKISAEGLQQYLSQISLSSLSPTALVWITKAMILRPPLPHPKQPGSTRQSYLLDQILSNLDGVIAKRLQILFSESDGLFDKSNRGHYSPFWQQKLFSTLYPQLKKVVYDAESDGNKVNGMLAFCFVVHGLSSSLLRVHFEEVVDTIVYVLSWLNNRSEVMRVAEDEVGLLEAQVIPAMTRILQEQPVAFVDHLKTVLPRLLEMAKNGTEARLRVAAIDCLASLLTHVSYTKLHVYKHSVLKTLQSILDDKKRVVRQRAAIVRNEWMLKQG